MDKTSSSSNILVSANRSFLSGLALLLGSLLKNYSGRSQIVINLISTDLDGSDVEMLRAYLGGLTEGRPVFKILLLDQHVLNSLTRLLPRDGPFSAEANSRLGIYKLFPNDDRVYYFDSDIFFDFDFAHFEEIELNGKPLAACAGMGDYTFDDWNKTQPEVQVPAHLRNLPYFNSGVLIFDLKAGRKKGCPSKLREVLSSEDLRSVNSDQAILNFAFAEQWNPLPEHFNYRIFIDLEDPQADALGQKVYHFVGPVKPWKIKTRSCRGIARRAQRFLEESGWYDYRQREEPSFTMRPRSLRSVANQLANGIRRRLRTPKGN